MQKSNETSTLELIEKHPLTQKLREDQAREIQKRRQAAADAIEKIEAQEREVLPKLQVEIDKLKAEVKDIEEKSKATRAELDRAGWKKFGEAQRLDREKSAHKDVLLSCYDPELNRATEHFQALYDKLRRVEINEQTRAGKRNLLSLRQNYNLYSNQENIEAALKYCQTAIREIESMKLEPAANYARIERLKRNLPDFNELKEYPTEKLMGSEATIRCTTAAGIIHERTNRLLTG
ncbi:MAG: hypothetical protein R6U27_14295 [Desulfobacterales bacterium]